MQAQLCANLIYIIFFQLYIQTRQALFSILTNRESFDEIWPLIDIYTLFIYLIQYKDYFSDTFKLYLIPHKCYVLC